MLVVLAPAAFPSGAAAARRLGTSVGAPVVDSAAGRVAWQPAAGSVHVLDLGSGAAARAYAVPAGCRPGGSGALRGDRLVLECDDGSRLLDLTTGATGPVPGAAAAGIGGATSGVLSAGSVWAEGWSDDAGVFFRLDGAAVERGEGTATTLPDLDAPELWRELCTPLRRSRSTDPQDVRTFLPYAYAPPLGLGHRPFEYRALRVDRCGHDRPLRLSRCPRACVAVHLGAGSVAWRERGLVRLYRGGGTRAGWRARRFGVAATPFPTRRHVVIAAGRYGAYSVWSVRAPT